MSPRHYRADRGSLGAVERLGTGALRIPATVTRIGIFEYMQPDGSVVRELRPPDEVYAPESLESLRGVPVTDLHPQEAMTLVNWPTLARGHIEAPRVIGDHLDADIVVSHPDLVTLVEQKQRREVSCGYDCEIDPTPGEWYGVPYDVVQRSIRYNHVALGPNNWARGGSSVRLHLDSKQQHRSKSMEFEFDREGKTLRIDGVSYTLPVDRDRAVAAARAAARRQKRVDMASPAEIAAALDETRGYLEMVVEQLAGLAAMVVEQDEQIAAPVEMDMEAMDKMYEDRADHIDRARKIAPDIDYKGLKIPEIRRKALEASGYKLDGTESEAEITGLFKGRTSLAGFATFPRADQEAMSQPAGEKPRTNPLQDKWKQKQGARA